MPFGDYRQTWLAPPIQQLLDVFSKTYATSFAERPASNGIEILSILVHSPFVHLLIDSLAYRFVEPLAHCVVDALSRLSSSSSATPNVPRELRTKEHRSL
jgi:hypothetical protein